MKASYTKKIAPTIASTDAMGYRLRVAIWRYLMNRYSLVLVGFLLTNVLGHLSFGQTRTLVGTVEGREVYSDPTVNEKTEIFQLRDGKNKGEFFGHSEFRWITVVPEETAIIDGRIVTPREQRELENIQLAAAAYRREEEEQRSKNEAGFERFRQRMEAADTLFGDRRASHPLNLELLYDNLPPQMVEMIASANENAAILVHQLTENFRAGLDAKAGEFDAKQKLNLVRSEAKYSEIRQRLGAAINEDLGFSAVRKTSTKAALVSAAVTDPNSRVLLDRIEAVERANSELDSVLGNPNLSPEDKLRLAEEIRSRLSSEHGIDLGS